MRQVHTSVISAAIRFFLSCTSSTFDGATSEVTVGDFDVICNVTERSVKSSIAHSAYAPTFPFPFGPPSPDSAFLLNSFIVIVFGFDFRGFPELVKPGSISRLYLVSSS